MSSTSTHDKATRWSRERVATTVARELKLTEFLADWQDATEALRESYAGMYALGMCRSGIARRLGVPIDRVPRLVGRADTETGGHDRPAAPERCVSTARPEFVVDDDHTF